MTDFHERIDEILGDDDALTDIRVTVRRLWLYDFDGYPVRLWQGKGRLFDTSGERWLGTIDSMGTDRHVTPDLQDGRDGSSGSYETSLLIPDLPGRPAFELYNALKADQGLAIGRSVTTYLALIEQGEGLRPQTPIMFDKEMTMTSVRFSEAIQRLSTGLLLRRYEVTVLCKDGNSGRAARPNSTYADTSQKQRAAHYGVSLDRGAEYLAGLANRTYQIP